MANHVRSPHPIRSFAAVGPQAHALIPSNTLVDLYGPLCRLVNVDGFVLLMGVGLDRMTAIHLAEQEAGRRMFVRWANGPDGRVIAVETGGCSDGFGRFEPILKPLERSIEVGQSRWTIYPLKGLLSTASIAIREDPSFTHCDDASCDRCSDAINGGPIGSVQRRT